MTHYPLSDVDHRLKNGERFVDLIVSRLRREGLQVDKTETRLRKESESRLPFEAEIDLTVSANGQNRIIEVKSKRVDFTSPESWRWGSVFLYNVNKTCQPWAVVLVSQITGSAIAVVRDGTWAQEDCFDTSREHPYKVWTAHCDSILSWGTFLTKLKSELGFVDNYDWLDAAV